MHEFNGHKSYTRLTFDYRVRLWASRAVSAVAELLVSIDIISVGPANRLVT